MLTLTLLRHAKSSWDTPDLDDIDRPLAPRGLKAAVKMGRALDQRGPNIELILCSPAKRTRQTCDLVLPEIAATPAVHFDDALYHGLPEMLLSRVQTQGEQARHVLLIGHNPGLEILAVRLTQSGPPEAIAAMTQKFPTAAAAQLAFDVPTWRDLGAATGNLTYFITPRALP